MLGVALDVSIPDLCILPYFDLPCLHQGSLNEASLLFTKMFIEFAKLRIHNKTILVREDDKAWYDTDIKRQVQRN